MADETEGEKGSEGTQSLRSGRVRIIGAEPAGGPPPRTEAETAPPETTEHVPQTLRPTLGDDGFALTLDAIDDVDQPVSVDDLLAPLKTVPRPAAPAPEPPVEPPAAAEVAETPAASAPPTIPPPLPTALPTWGEGDPPSADLPHWTDAPTGEVPSILDRSGDESGSTRWSSVPGPTWREGHGDWEDSEDSFEPAMLGDDEPRLGSLDDSAAAGDEERQPWSFELTDSPSSRESAAQMEERLISAGLNDYDDGETMLVPSLGLSGPSSTDPVTTSSEVSHEEPGTTTSPWELDNAGRDVDAVLVGDRDDGVAVVEADQLDPEEEKSFRSRIGRGRNRRLRPVPQAPPPATGSDSSEPVIGSRPVPLAPESTPTPEGRPVPQAPEEASGPKVIMAPRARPPARAGAAASSSDTAGTSGRNMPVAIVSGVVLAIVALVAFKLGTVATMVLVCLVLVLAAGEAFSAFRRAHYHPAVLLGLLATLVLAIETYNKGVAAFPLTMVVLVAASFLWFIFGVEAEADPVAGMSSTVFVFVWIAGFGSFAALLLCPDLFPNRTGIAFLLGAIIVTVFCDVGSLLAGSQFGRRPMAPEISPNKSWEGFIGGAVLAVLSAVVIVQFIHPWTFKSAACLGVVVAVVAPLGDLCESLLKRNLGMKDMSNMLPGHGGLLDRLDGLLFVLPATYFLVRAFNLG